MFSKIKSAYASALAGIEGKKTYIWATVVTLVCFAGMFTGKLDFQTGFMICSTMGIGSLLRASQPDKKFDKLIQDLPPVQVPATIPEDAPAVIVAAPAVVAK